MIRVPWGMITSLKLVRPGTSRRIPIYRYDRPLGGNRLPISDPRLADDPTPGTRSRRMSTSIPSRCSCGAKAIPPFSIGLPIGRERNENPILVLRLEKYQGWNFSRSPRRAPGSYTHPVGLGSPPHLQMSFMGPFLKTAYRFLLEVPTSLANLRIGGITPFLVVHGACSMDVVHGLLSHLERIRRRQFLCDCFAPVLTVDQKPFTVRNCSGLLAKRQATYATYSHAGTPHPNPFFGKS